MKQKTARCNNYNIYQGTYFYIKVMLEDTANFVVALYLLILCTDTTHSRQKQPKSKR